MTERTSRTRTGLVGIVAAAAVVGSSLLGTTSISQAQIPETAAPAAGTAASAPATAPGATAQERLQPRHRRGGLRQLVREAAQQRSQADAPERLVAEHLGQIDGELRIDQRL